MEAFDEVDVNVHPNKKEVRFQNARKVYGAIYRAIMRVLEGYELQKTKNLVADFSEISPENCQNLAKEGLVGEQNDDRGSQKSNSSMSFEEALSLVRGPCTLSHPGYAVWLLQPRHCSNPYFP